MSTKYCGQPNGFRPTGKNDVTPNPNGPPTTKFMGRGGVPEGPLKRFPGITEDVGNGNRRLARSRHGEGMGDGVDYCGSPSGFMRGRK